MSRKIIFRIAFCALFFISLVSCSDGAKKSYVDLIPKDVAQVLSLDVASLSEKAGLGDPENEKYKTLLLNDIDGSMSESATQLLTDIVANPANTGVDFNVPIYLFVPTTTTEIPNPGLVAKMGDKIKFETLITELINEEVLKAVVENDDFSYSETEDGSAAILYSEEFIFVATQIGDSKEYPAIRVGSEIYEASRVENASSNKAFNMMQELTGDIKFLTSLASLPDNMKSQLVMSTSLVNIDLTNMTIVGASSFNVGEINIDLTAYSEDTELQKEFEEAISSAKKMNGNLMNKFPASSLAVISAYFDGALINEKIEENPELVSQLSADKEAAEAVKSFIESVDGDVAVSVVSFNNITDFTVLAYAELNSDGAKALEALCNNKKINNGILKKKEENKYAYETAFFSLYLGIENGMLYFTNRKDYEIGKDVTPSASVEYPGSNGKSLFFAVNFKDLYSVLKSLRLTRSVPKELREPIEEINTFEASISNDGFMNYKITLVNNDTNSLKLFLDYIKDMID